jgi:hypothetical protein
MPTDTPIENRYPWLAVGEEEGPKLPDNPTERDLAKAYATMLMVYQSQRKEIVKAMEAHRDERREVLALLKTISTHQTHSSPMPMWAKIHSGVMLLQAAAIVWLTYVLTNHQHLLEKLSSFHQ